MESISGDLGHKAEDTLDEVQTPSQFKQAHFLDMFFTGDELKCIPETLGARWKKNQPPDETPVHHPCTHLTYMLQSEVLGTFEVFWR